MYIFRKKTGFTLIEVLMAMLLIGMVSIPFIKSIIMGLRGAKHTDDYVNAYNLAREKQEEYKMLSFSDIKSSYDIFSHIYKDELDYKAEIANKKEEFDKIFSDIFTAAKADARIYHKFKRAYKSIFKKDYKNYEDKYDDYRRIVDVEEVKGKNIDQVYMKKITVKVYKKDIKKKKYILVAILPTLITKY